MYTPLSKMNLLVIHVHSNSPSWYKSLKLSQKGFIKVGKCGLPLPNHIPAKSLFDLLNLQVYKKTVNYM